MLGGRRRRARSYLPHSREVSCPLLPAWVLQHSRAHQPDADFSQKFNFVDWRIHTALAQRPTRLHKCGQKPAQEWQLTACAPTITSTSASSRIRGVCVATRPCTASSILRFVDSRGYIVGLHIIRVHCLCKARVRASSAWEWQVTACARALHPPPHTRVGIRGVHVRLHASDAASEYSKPS